MLPMMAHVVEPTPATRAMTAAVRTGAPLSPAHAAVTATTATKATSAAPITPAPPSTGRAATTVSTAIPVGIAVQRRPVSRTAGSAVEVSPVMQASQRVASMAAARPGGCAAVRCHPSPLGRVATIRRSPTAVRMLPTRTEPLAHAVPMAAAAPPAAQRLGVRNRHEATQMARWTCRHHPVHYTRAGPRPASR